MDQIANRNTRAMTAALSPLREMGAPPPHGIAGRLAGVAAVLVVETPAQIRPVQTKTAEPPDLALGLFAYLLALSETDAKPEDEGARAGDLRRRAGGGFWIFDGEVWIEW